MTETSAEVAEGRFAATAGVGRLVRIGTIGSEFKLGPQRLSFRLAGCR